MVLALPRSAVLQFHFQPMSRLPGLLQLLLECCHPPKGLCLNCLSILHQGTRAGEAL